MILTVFAGPNGSGKSTIVKDYLKENPMVFVCPDEYVKDYSFIQDKKKRYKMAMDEAEEDRFTFLNAGAEFSFETVFSRSDKLKFLTDALENGYYIKVFFITTSNPSINIERIQRRVDSGGHCVKEQDIIQRYHRSMAMLLDIIDIAHEVSIYDNSETDGSPALIIFKNQYNDCYFFHNKYNSPVYEELKERILEKEYLKFHQLNEEETEVYRSSKYL